MFKSWQTHGFNRESCAWKGEISLTFPTVAYYDSCTITFQGSDEELMVHSEDEHEQDTSGKGNLWC